VMFVMVFMVVAVTTAIRIIAFVVVLMLCFMMQTFKFSLQAVFLLHRFYNCFPV
jgi:hypothetical protein